MMHIFKIIYPLKLCFFRAEASASQLAELNPYVNIQTSTSSISNGNFEFLTHYQVSFPTVKIGWLDSFHLFVLETKRGNVITNYTVTASRSASFKLRIFPGQTHNFTVNMH